jgi:LemA protein
MLMVAENYPDLKADQTVQSLMGDLRDTENWVGSSRQGYNQAAMEYNQAREVFPAVLFAGIFGFQPAEFWALENKAEGERVVISLDPKAGPPAGPGSPGSPNP